MQTQTAASSTSSRLGSVRRGRIVRPLRMLFYGAEGLGKSTLAAHAPAPIFLDVEGGTEQIECARYPFEGDTPARYEQILEAVADLRASKHEFQTLVIDTVDSLEALLWAYVCRRDSDAKKKLAGIEDYGYGKGYQVALDEWRRLASVLDDLRVSRGIGIVLLGHTVIRTYKNPMGEDFDRYNLRIHDKSAGFLKEWCDVVGFIAPEEGATKLNDDDRKAKGYSTGRRLLYLERTAAYDAKTRIPMPPAVELDHADPWGPFSAAVDAGRDLKPEDLVKLIDAELERLGDPELAKLATAKVAEARQDTATLGRILNRLRSK